MIKIKEYKFILITACFIVLYAFFSSNVNLEPIEKMDIPSAIGIDFKKNSHGKMSYMVFISAYIFSENKSPQTVIHAGIGDTIGQTRQNRQLKTNHRFILGLQKSYIFSENVARNGMKNLMYILFSNPEINDMGVVVVCKGDTMNMLKHKVNGYPSSADYIEGMVKNCSDFNFFSQNYKLIDIYVRLDSEGRNLTLPYIEVKNGQIRMTGMALFKKFKMQRKIGISQSRIMNLLRENNTKGVISIIKNSQKNIDVVVKAKRKIYCERKNGKYEFLIKLSLEGDIANNSIYENIEEPKNIDKFEKDIKKSIKKMCYKFIGIMQNNYKLDCLELGRVAAAKYGRRKGVDWDKVVSKSKIKVEIEYETKSFGRGDFLKKLQK